jgi:UDP:flavonoid glycosyltransferase YjiC (YdhE family)
LDNASNGLIYFSMGSILKSSSFPEAMKRELLELFRGLPQTVLWKYEEKIPDLPENVHVVNWVPQIGVLGKRDRFIHYIHITHVLSLDISDISLRHLHFTKMS